jgi:zinc/manganese transport system substrate-binding protein
VPPVPSSPPAQQVRWPVVLPGLLVAVTVLLCGCATSLPPQGEGSVAYASRVVRMVAAEDFWGSIAAQIGGAHAHVVSIIDNPEMDPHAYEPTAADARTLADAQVAVLNGAGYDPWMQQLLAADGGHRAVLDVGDLVGVAPGGNPHLWYDPAFVDRYIGAVTTDLQRADRTSPVAGPPMNTSGWPPTTPRSPGSGRRSPGRRSGPRSRSSSICAGPSGSTW